MLELVLLIYRMCNINFNTASTTLMQTVKLITYFALVTNCATLLKKQ